MSIKVLVRARPSSERLEHSETSMTIEDARGSIVECQVDRVFGEGFDDYVGKIVEDFAAGTSAMIVAYGQSGSGKTYSLGLLSHGGILGELYQRFPGRLKVSFRQIYCGKLLDMFSGSSAHPAVETVDSSSALKCVIERALKGRYTSSTQLNAHSSRSHAILTLHADSGAVMTLVDLAGSERQRNLTTKLQRVESTHINSSLSALIGILRQLKQGQPHISWRDNILTRTLAASFTTDTSVYFLCCISLDHKNRAETINTLRYAQTARGARLLPAPGPSPKKPVPNEIWRYAKMLRFFSWSQSDPAVITMTDHNVSVKPLLPIRLKPQRRRRVSILARWQLGIAIALCVCITMYFELMRLPANEFHLQFETIKSQP